MQQIRETIRLFAEQLLKDPDQTGTTHSFNESGR